VVTNKARLQELLADERVWSGKKYPTMLRSALDSRRVKDIRMLSAEDKHLPGYGPNEELSIEVLGPVIEPDQNAQPRLRWFGGSSETGPTKNGHSVVLRLRYGNLKMLLGGDLNIPSEKLLLGHHTELPIPPTTAARWMTTSGRASRSMRSIASRWRSNEVCR